MPENGPIPDVEALLATVARLFATEGDSEAVALLSAANAIFDWYSHDNWDGGFDIWNLRLEVPFSVYRRLVPKRTDLEESVRLKVQAVLEGRSRDHIQSVSICTELTAG